MVFSFPSKTDESYPDDGDVAGTSVAADAAFVGYAEIAGGRLIDAMAGLEITARGVRVRAFADWEDTAIVELVIGCYVHKREYRGACTRLTGVTSTYAGYFRRDTLYWAFTLSIIRRCR